MSEQNHCINCGIGIWRNSAIGMHQLNDEGIRSIIQQWVAPQVVESSHLICQACWNLAVTPMVKTEKPEPPTVGHRQVCINCGRSVLRTRHHVLRTDTERENNICTVIQEWIAPRCIQHGRAIICHSCWVRADKDAQRFINLPSSSSIQKLESPSVNLESPLVKQESPSSSITPLDSISTQTPKENPHGSSDCIVLPHYFRAKETQRRCFVEGCQSRDRIRVINSQRKKLLKTVNFYIPKNNRLCKNHINTESWDFLKKDRIHYVNVFTASQIEDMIQLLLTDGPPYIHYGKTIVPTSK